ncbi:3,4-dihydroxy-2-butanone-4-phosphate synthase [Brevibacterium paucivorans]|uniref:3,4-dihydroxy-2-butanone-4-phosphate synthase n=1 Tax=Brevibacterium paucivorans TaxID=170994 RepID=UPI0025D4E505|nr:3,4-dihydroxy-2-butanone-4-phosphate synthase [uncultured Brevibacterium sp.]
MTVLDSIDHAIAELKRGRPIVVVDDEDRENEGDLIMPARTVTPEWMGFMVRHTSGVVCVPMLPERAAELGLHPMVANNQDPKSTAYTVSCDAAAGVSTGISAADRAHTANLLANPDSDASDFTRPGHMFPLIAKPGGVRERDGHTEAGVEFARLAGFEPVAVIAEIVHDDGSMMRTPDLRGFADQHELALVSIHDLTTWLNAHDATPHPRTGQCKVTGTSAVDLPTPWGTFAMRAWTGPSGAEHVTLERPGLPAAGDQQDAPLVRVHSECVTGDVFGSMRCDCGEQLHESLRLISEHGGLLVYVGGHEGRGIGLANKVRAYALQDAGLDTLDANTRLGLPADARSYAEVAAVLRACGLTRVRLVTNNPDKVAGLEEHGVSVAERVPVEVPATAHNARYLWTKAQRMGHILNTHERVGA